MCPNFCAAEFTRLTPQLPNICELVLYKDNESLEGGVDILCNSKYSEEEDIYHFEMAHKYVKKGEKPK